MKKFKLLLPALGLLGALAMMGAMPQSGEAPVVYYSKDINPAKLQAVYSKLGFAPSGKLAVKVHFGEEGNRNFIPPELLKQLVTGLKGTFVETNTLYGGSRGDTAKHLATAREHGWTYTQVDILDSEGETTIPYSGKYFDKVYVGKGMAKYDSFLVISHFKGHSMGGFGGAVKNLAMGFGSPAGKMAQHSGQIPTIVRGRCMKCGNCRRTCPVNAIDENFNIDRSKCIGCGKCKAYCPFNAIESASGPSKGPVFQEKIAEYAKGVTARGKFTYINLAMNISKACDCSATAPKPFIGDVGILASNDPVALDQASFDMVNRKAGIPDAFEHETGVSGLHTLEYAEAIGLGKRTYRLVEVK